MLSAWQKYYAVSPNSDASVRAEPLWHNRFLQWKGLRRFQDVWSNKGVSRIKDIIFEGSVMSREMLRDRYDINLSLRTYNAMLKVIPQDFLDYLSEEEDDQAGTGLYVPNCKGELTDITNITVKIIYKVFLWTECKVPTAVKSWQRICPGQEHVFSEGIWEHWWRLPYKLTREERLQSFCYRVLNKIIPCNVYLKQLRVKDSEECSFCHGRDDLYHYFYGCNDTAVFWKGVCKWLKNNSAVITVPRNIPELEFLLGIVDTDEIDFRLNFILMLGKFYVYREKIFGDGLLEPYKFLVELKAVLNTERIICLKEGKLVKKFSKWQHFYDEL